LVFCEVMMSMWSQFIERSLGERVLSFLSEASPPGLNPLIHGTDPSKYVR